MKAGVEEKGIGGSGRIVRKSYTLTSGSGKGRVCLATALNLKLGFRI